jgi:hypothetical protein
VAAEAPRFHLHFTPTSSSWMNLVERWFAELTNRKLHRSAHRSVTEFENERSSRPLLPTVAESTVFTVLVNNDNPDSCEPFAAGLV